jgi:hypothetical protein
LSPLAGKNDNGKNGSTVWRFIAGALIGAVIAGAPAWIVAIRATSEEDVRTIVEEHEQVDLPQIAALVEQIGAIREHEQELSAVNAQEDVAIASLEATLMQLDTVQEQLSQLQGDVRALQAGATNTGG